MTQYGATEKYVNGHYIIDNVKPGGLADRAGIKTGDTLVSINSMPPAAHAGTGTGQDLTGHA